MRKTMITTGLFLVLAGAVWAENPPSFELPWLDEKGNLRLVLQGTAGASYTIEGSTNLVDWVALFTGSAADGRLELSGGTSDADRCFFRCRMDQLASNDGLVGVWMAFVRRSPFFADGNYELMPRWYTFYADGLAFWDIPREGFDGFDRNGSQSDPDQRALWGTYTYQNGSGSIVRPGVTDPDQIDLEKAGQIKLGLYSYYRCVSVDGLLLEGAWTSRADPDDPFWATHPDPIGKRPIIRFTKDGRFTDEGIFVTLLTPLPDKAQDAAGSGTYVIKNFTLTLRYSDGRLKRVAITGFLSADPTTDNDLLYFSRAQFQKMKP